MSAPVRYDNLLSEVNAIIGGYDPMEVLAGVTEPVFESRRSADKPSTLRIKADFRPERQMMSSPAMDDMNRASESSPVVKNEAQISHDMMASLHASTSHVVLKQVDDEQSAFDGKSSERKATKGLPRRENLSQKLSAHEFGTTSQVLSQTAHAIVER